MTDRQVWTAEAADDAELLAGPPPEEPVDLEDLAVADRLAFSFRVNNWKMREIIAKRGRAAHIADVFNDEIEALTERRDALVGPLLDACNEREAEIEAWHRTMHASGDAGLTIELPSGVSKLKASQTELVWDDLDEFTAWAETAEITEERTVADLVFTQPAPALQLANFKKAFGLSKAVDDEAGTILAIHTDDGEVVPGVHRVARGRSHNITLGVPA